MYFFDMKTRPYPVQLLISGLTYGSGLLIGNVVSFLLSEQIL